MSKTITDRIYASLSERIIKGQFSPGQKLRQDHIAQEFQTSHVPVREAFLRLEGRGLAETQPRRGTRVSALDPADLREVVEMRVSLEILAMQHAAVNFTRKDLDLADTARKACDAAQTMTDWEKCNREFHRILLSPCQMPRLLSAIDDLHLASARHLFAHWKHQWSQRADQDHAAIVRALKRYDAAAAIETLRRHLRRVR